MQPANRTTSELVIFDVCDTLYYANTTFDFIRFVLQRKGLTSSLFMFNLLNKRVSPVFLSFALLQKFSKKDFIRNYSLKLLKGLKRSELNAEGLAFEKHYLSQHIISETHSLLQQFKEKQASIVLVSSGIEPVIAAIAQKLNLPHRASSLAFDASDCFTGELVTDLTGQKEKALEIFLNGTGNYITIVTDNFSDINLVKKAKKRYIVVYNEKAKSFWKGLKPKFICLSPS